MVMGLSAESRAQMWMGTTDEFYYEGIASADKNGMYRLSAMMETKAVILAKRLKGRSTA
jgi:hypothetical protein